VSKWQQDTTSLSWRRENIYIHCDDATWKQGNWSKLTRCVLNTHCSKAAEVASSFVQVASSLAQVASSTNQRIYYFYCYFKFFSIFIFKKQLYFFPFCSDMVLAYEGRCWCYFYLFIFFFLGSLSWLFMIGQLRQWPRPPVHHPLETCYDSVRVGFEPPTNLMSPWLVLAWLDNPLFIRKGATMNQHPPPHHPLDAHYYSIVDEPQLS
jgi:hypothetical protein